MNNHSQKTALPFHDHFQLGEEELKKILSLALSRGGDFAEIYMEYNRNNFINMAEDIIKETAESISMGIGIRVTYNDQTGYAYSNSCSLEELRKAALTAAAIATEQKTVAPSPLQSIPVPHNYYTIREGAATASLNRKIDMVKRAYAAAQQADPVIKKVKVALADQLQSIRIINSDGLNIVDTRPLVKMSCVSIAEKSGEREAGFMGGGGRVGLEYFKNILTPEQIGQEASIEAIKLLHAEQPPAGEMPVVLAPGHSGVLIHEAVGHLLEADFIRKKTSVFWDKLGKQVGNEQVNIFDDPTIPYFRGSYNIDDEGTIPHKTQLLENGKIINLIQDRLSARLLQMPVTGHGRRQDYSCIPIPRMSNTYIDKGEYSPEEILKSVAKGFYALHYQGGQVEDSGKFTFSVSSGFLIENGRLTTPVKQATLIGSNIDILRKISMVGCDLEFSWQTGTCGKAGQSAPVTDGCPTLKIIGMTVGGQN